jgi:2-polyprenyl-6-hydroxyphenyl methylase/3-demethylubiquinone-9 3-methyltransferase
MGKMDSHFNPLWDYGHIKFWSKKTLTRLFDEAGLGVTQFHRAGRIPILGKSMVLVLQHEGWKKSDNGG